MWMRSIALSEPEEAVREAFAKEISGGIDVIVNYLWGRPTELLFEELAKGFKVGVDAAYAHGRGGRERRQNRFAAWRTAAQH